MKFFINCSNSWVRIAQFQVIHVRGHFMTSVYFNKCWYFEMKCHWLFKWGQRAVLNQFMIFMNSLLTTLLCDFNSFKFYLKENEIPLNGFRLCFSAIFFWNVMLICNVHSCTPSHRILVVYHFRLSFRASIENLGNRDLLHNICRLIVRAQTIIIRPSFGI